MALRANARPSWPGAPGPRRWPPATPAWAHRRRSVARPSPSARLTTGLLARLAGSGRRTARASSGRCAPAAVGLAKNASAAAPNPCPNGHAHRASPGGPARPRADRPASRFATPASPRRFASPCPSAHRPGGGAIAEYRPPQTRPRSGHASAATPAQRRFAMAATGRSGWRLMKMVCPNRSGARRRFASGAGGPGGAAEFAHRSTPRAALGAIRRTRSLCRCESAARAGRAATAGRGGRTLQRVGLRLALPPECGRRSGDSHAAPARQSAAAQSRVATTKPRTRISAHRASAVPRRPARPAAAPRANPRRAG